MYDMYCTIISSYECYIVCKPIQTNIKIKKLKIMLFLLNYDNLTATEAYCKNFRNNDYGSFVPLLFGVIAHHGKDLFAITMKV